MKGIELDRIIEKELIKMVEEGHHSSPISQTAVFIRLKSKGVINSKATLTRRRRLIEDYKEKQISDVGGAFGQALTASNNQTRASLIARNAELAQQLEMAKRQLSLNTQSLLNIIKAIKAETPPSSIERILSPYLIRELGEE